MKDIEKLMLNRFIKEMNVSPDISKWDNETLSSWLKGIPDLDINAVMENGTPEDIKELIALYKSEVVKNNKILSIGLIEHEGVFDDPPEDMSERNYYFNII